MNALIAGAGIGGLCTALCLQKSGHEVRLIEQANNFSNIGGGLQLGANALKVFDYLGLSSQLQALSVEPERVSFCSYATGEVLHSAELGAHYSSKYGAPYLHVHRADLHALLLQSLLTGTRVELNSAVTSYHEDSQSVSVALDDGSRVEGDYLIGADGIRSVIRAQMLGHCEPKFTGNIAWRGVVPVEQLPDNFMDKAVLNFVGPKKHMVIYYLRQQRLVNFVGVVENSEWHEESWTSKAPWQELKKDFSGWHNTVQTVIDAMDKDQCYRWALYNHKPTKNWSSERVTLLGDAAHATLPFLASGAAMAIEDSRVLQRALDQAEQVEQAFKLYQKNRFERTAKIQQLSSQMARLYHITNPLLLKLAFKAVKHKSASVEAFLADYDANIISLNE